MTAMQGAVPILVIDDNPLNAKLTRLLLSRHGYLVATARDADEALALIETVKPHLILMDLQLPRLDGFALTRQLKRNPALRDVIVIALTAYAMKGDEQRALEAGCDGYISKPIDTRTLPQVVSRYLAAREGGDG